MKMDPALIIFDFDGTIVDSKALYYGSISNVLKKYGFGEEKIEETIDLGIKLKGILEELGFSWLSRWWVRRKIMKDVLERIGDVKKCKDVSAIEELDTRKILITNSLAEFVMPVLDKLGIRNYFSEIYTAEGFDNKAKFINDYLERRDLDKEKCVYVGDRVADIGVAEKVGCLSLVVAGKCAWDSREELLEKEPDFIIDDLVELEEMLGA